MRDLIQAVQDGNASDVEEIFRQGSRQKHINEALFIACRDGFSEIVRIILTDRQGHQANTFSGMPLIAAAQKGRLEIIDILLSHGLWDDLNAAVGAAALTGQLKTVQYLIGLGANGSTPGIFERAVSGGHVQVVQFLINQGMVQNHQYDQALRLAVEKGHSEIVRTILRNGKDLNISAAYQMVQPEDIVTEQLLGDIIRKEKVFGRQSGSYL